MRRPVCPDGQNDLFDAATMHKLFQHPEPAAPLPPLPFERKEEVDRKRAAAILGVTINTLQRMIGKQISGYQVLPGSGTYRIRHSSLVEYCDSLRLRYFIPPRRSTGRRPVDADILPFPLTETMSCEEVARHLDVKKDAVIKLIDLGLLVAYKLNPDEPASPWRIHRPSVERRLRDMQAEAAPKQAVRACTG